jgi:hypothetical protein
MSRRDEDALPIWDLVDTGVFPVEKDDGSPIPDRRAVVPDSQMQEYRDELHHILKAIPGYGGATMTVPVETGLWSLQVLYNGVSMLREQHKLAEGDLKLCIERIMTPSQQFELLLNAARGFWDIASAAGVEYNPNDPSLSKITTHVTGLVKRKARKAAKSAV